jgi:sugar/nucleoside kinase (ribokinase family)
MGPTAGQLTRDLLVVGELCVDLIIPLENEIRFGQHEQLVAATTLTMGSSSAITACGAAALGIRTSLVSVRGDDTFGRFLDAELHRLGVDTGLVRLDRSVPTGASTHLTRADGDRAILTSLGSIGRVADSDVSDEALRSARHLHMGSYFLQESLWPDARKLFQRARALGLSTSLDGNFAPEQEWDRGILTVLPDVETFFANDEELCGIARMSDPLAAALRLLQVMPEGAVVVRKLGAAGAQAIGAHGMMPEVVRVGIPEAPGGLVDTVGAGDSLAAGFIAARLNGLSLAESIAMGVSCGSASTRGAGGTGSQPDWNTALALSATVRPQVHPLPV